jgi:hypothetical protein
MPPKFSVTPKGGYPNSMFKESPITPSDGKDLQKTSQLSNSSSGVKKYKNIKSSGYGK